MVISDSSCMIDVTIALLTEEFGQVWAKLPDMRLLDDVMPQHTAEVECKENGDGWMVELT